MFTTIFNYEGEVVIFSFQAFILQFSVTGLLDNFVLDLIDFSFDLQNVKQSRIFCLRLALFYFSLTTLVGEVDFLTAKLNFVFAPDLDLCFYFSEVDPFLTKSKCCLRFPLPTNKYCYGNLKI